METNTPPFTEISHTRRNLAALSYAWILSLPVLLSGKDDPFVGPHARQGTLLFTFSIIAWFIPYAGYVLELLLGVAMVAGYIRASQGRSFTLPIFTDGVSGLLARSRMEWDRLWGRAGPQDIPPSSVDASERENQLSACAYLSIASVIVADNDRDSPTIRFHARQGMTIFLLSVVAGLLGTPGRYLLVLLLIVSVAGFLSALMGKATSLPLIHAISLRLPTLDAAWSTIKARILQWFGSKQDAPSPTIETTPDNRERSLGMLSYFLLGPVFLLSPNPSPFATFHARQGLLLNATLIGLYALYPTAYSALAVVMALTLLGASRAHRGLRSSLPVVSELVHGLAWAFTVTKRHAQIPELPNGQQAPTGDDSLHHG